MPDLGWQELVIILVIVIIIFGAGKLPEIGGALGKTIKEFKANTEDVPGIGKPTTSTGTTTAARSMDPVPATMGNARADEI